MMTARKPRDSTVGLDVIQFGIFQARRAELEGQGCHEHTNVGSLPENAAALTRFFLRKAYATKLGRYVFD